MRERPAVACVGEPLARHAPGFRAWLRQRGYRPSTVEDQAFLMGHLSRWLAEAGLQPSAFTVDVVDQFRRVRRESHSHLSGARGLDQLLGYLRRVGAVPAPPGPDSSFEHVVTEYREYLVRPDLSEHNSERMPAIQHITIRRDHHRGQTIRPAW